MQIQDIKVAFLTLSLVSLFNILKFCYKITCSVENCVKYYISNLLKLFMFTRKTNISNRPDNRMYKTVIPQTQENITIPSIEPFFVLVTLLAFIF